MESTAGIATGRRLRLGAPIVVAGMVLLALIVGFGWQHLSERSLVGASGVVTITVVRDCANPSAVFFKGYTWEASSFAPDGWPSGDLRGRFTVKTPTSGEFTSLEQPGTVDYRRNPHKGSFSAMPCAIR